MPEDTNHETPPSELPADSPPADAPKAINLAAIVSVIAFVMLLIFLFFRY